MSKETYKEAWNRGERGDVSTSELLVGGALWLILIVALVTLTVLFTKAIALIAIVSMMAYCVYKFWDLREDKS